jgi:hypothetical protein
VPSPSTHSPERKTHTAAADSPLDTATLLASIALIGLTVFLLLT